MDMDNIPLFQLPDKMITRWSSPENWTGEPGKGGQVDGGRKGSPCFRLPAGETRTLAEVSGCSGTVRRIWATINNRSPEMLRGLRLDMYWDGAPKPAVSAPFGDFFGQGLGRAVAFQSALFTNPEGRSFNCYIPMPFKQGMKILVANETAVDLEMFFYDVDYTLGDPHGENMLYFHAHWRREKPTQMQQDYEILPYLPGKGRFLGANLGVIADTQRYFYSWWGEGEVKIYLDGDEAYPTLCGTGTEDYIGTGWGQGQYAHLYQGCHLADHQHFQYAFYRYHVLDPVYFYQDIRVTIQQIGCWDANSFLQMRAAGQKLVAGSECQPVDMDKAVLDSPYGLFERQDDWSSCCYFYLNSPVNALPHLLSVEARTAGLLAGE